MPHPSGRSRFRALTIPLPDPQNPMRAERSEESDAPSAAAPGRVRSRRSSEASSPTAPEQSMSWFRCRFSKKFNDRVIADFRVNRGRVGPWGTNLILIHHRGARTGLERVTPAMSLRDGDAWLVVGSAMGAPRDPAWVHNLRVHPDVEIDVPREQRCPHRVRSGHRLDLPCPQPRIPALRSRRTELRGLPDQGRALTAHRTTRTDRHERVLRRRYRG